jgi:hypothetical protein
LFGHPLERHGRLPAQPQRDPHLPLIPSATCEPGGQRARESGNRSIVKTRGTPFLSLSVRVWRRKAPDEEIAVNIRENYSCAPCNRVWAAGSRALVTIFRALGARPVSSGGSRCRINAAFRSAWFHAAFRSAWFHAAFRSAWFRNAAFTRQPRPAATTGAHIHRAIARCPIATPSVPPLKPSSLWKGVS